ncbi:teichuronic acid biosynthesis glycosyltransferase TuaG [Rossellomorea marisflavi]
MLNNEKADDGVQVSIVMPAYNCGEFIDKTIDSVLRQTYVNWELIVVDDCSSDNTREIVTNYLEQDNRIVYLRLEKNSGAAVARNAAIDLAKGEYIAFLDSDDIWTESKLSKQIHFMEKNSYSFTCTDYDKIDEDGSFLNLIVRNPTIRDYNYLLKSCPGNSTIIYKASELGKFFIPDIKKRNDYVMWLRVIKEAHYLYNYNEVLSSHRIRAGGISKNKFSLVKYHWIVYREMENLSLFKSTYLVIYWILVTALKLRKVH